MTARTPDLNNPTSKREMRFLVYVLGSRGETARRTYVGWTTDLKRRLQQQNAGRVAVICTFPRKING